MICYSCRRHVAILITTLLIAFLPFTANAQKRIALVIGNANYTSIPIMPKSKNDAILMAEKLTELGFQVIKILDSDREKMINGFEEISSAMENGADVGLFYFSGKGASFNGSDHVLPIESSGKKSEWLSINKFIKIVAKYQSAVKIVILDTDRSHPGASSAGAGISSREAVDNLFMGFATSPGGVIAPAQLETNLFTAAILQMLDAQGLDINSLFSKVRVDVFTSSNQKQMPWSNSSLLQYFYLNNKK